MFDRRTCCVAGWRDMDYNSHMANTAYLDRAADVRMMYFAENGFTVADMLRMKIGPVIMKDEIEYYREVKLAAGDSRDASPSPASRPTAAVSCFATNSRTWTARTAPPSPAPADWLDLNVRKLIATARAAATRRWWRCRRSKDSASSNRA